MVISAERHWPVLKLLLCRHSVGVSLGTTMCYIYQNKLLIITFFISEATFDFIVHVLTLVIKINVHFCSSLLQHDSGPASGS